MTPIRSVEISTDFGAKQISVYNCSVLDFDEEIDIMTISSHIYSYTPTPNTLLGAMDIIGISVMELADYPMLDLRRQCGVWLSYEVEALVTRIRRIGCIETANRLFQPPEEREQTLTNSIRSYFRMLDIAAVYNTKMDTIVLPLIGSGEQRFSAELVLVPLLSESLSFLKRNPAVRRICFVDSNPLKAQLIAAYLGQSYQLNFTEESPRHTSVPRKPADSQPCAFISHSSHDVAVAEALCAKLEHRGVKVWYAPRDVIGPYAQAITSALRNSSHFITLLSRSSMESQNVLNEIDFACQKLIPNIKIKPIRIDSTPIPDAFSYYLGIHHYMDATCAPLDACLDEFVNKFMTDL